MLGGFIHDFFVRSARETYTIIHSDIQGSALEMLPILFRAIDTGCIKKRHLTYGIWGQFSNACNNAKKDSH